MKNNTNFCQSRQAVADTRSNARIIKTAEETLGLPVLHDRALIRKPKQHDRRSPPDAGPGATRMALGSLNGCVEFSPAQLQFPNGREGGPGRRSRLSVEVRKEVRILESVVILCQAPELEVLYVDIEEPLPV